MSFSKTVYPNRLGYHLSQTTMVQVLDHAGTPVKCGRARVNGIRLYYIMAGKGPALVLVHGTPKNSFYWYKLFPLLTEHFTLVAPDLRGFGCMHPLWLCVMTITPMPRIRQQD